MPVVTASVMRRGAHHLRTGSPFAVDLRWRKAEQRQQQARVDVYCCAITRDIKKDKTKLILPGQLQPRCQSKKQCISGDRSTVRKKQKQKQTLI